MTQRIGLLIAIITVFTGSQISLAQTAPVPQLIITWHANSYVPPGYLGKNLPVANTRVDLALETLINGRALDISSNEIRWFVNNSLLQSGVGLTRTSFTTSPYGGSNYIIKAVIRDEQSGDLEKSLIIPIAAPLIVIDAPYPDLKISHIKNTFTALPYFFAVPDLSQLAFSWSANGATTTGGAKLELTTPGGKTGDALNLSITATNKKSEIEQAQNTINLIMR